jgi:hypothetical protein
MSPIYPFKRAFKQLSLILRRRESPFTTPPPQTTDPPLSHTPPLQTSNPINPQYSSSSTGSSMSRESNDEHYTSLFAINYLFATMESIESELDKIAWYSRSGYRLETTLFLLPVQY